jgi:hypothetical protein
MGNQFGGFDATLQTLLSQAVRNSSSGPPKSQFNVLEDTSPNNLNVDDSLTPQYNEDGTPVKTRLIVPNLGRMEIITLSNGQTFATLRTNDGVQHQVFENNDGILYFNNPNHPLFPGVKVPQAVAYADGTLFPSSKTTIDGEPCQQTVAPAAKDDPACAGTTNTFGAYFKQGTQSPLFNTFNCVFGNLFQIYGQFIYYYPVSEHDTEYDPIFGEDPNKAYFEKYTLKGLVEEQTEEEILYNEFGLHNADEGFRFKILKQTFIDTVGREPIPGDQFIYSLSQHRYEVVHVEDKENQVLGSRIVYTIRGRSAVISGEQYGIGRVPNFLSSNICSNHRSWHNRNYGYYWNS